MPSTSRDYAPTYIDPVVEVERAALERGFRRGCLYTAIAFLGCYVVFEFLTAAGQFATERLIPWLQAVL